LTIWPLRLGLVTLAIAAAAAPASAEAPRNDLLYLELRDVTSRFVLTAEGTPRRTITRLVGVNSVTWFRNGRRFAVLRASTNLSEEVDVVDAETGKRWRVLRLGIPTYHSVAVSPRGDALALTHSNAVHRLVVFSLRTQRRRVLLRRRINALDGIAWSPDGRTIAHVLPSGRGYGLIGLLDLRTGRRRVVSRTLLAKSPAWSPDGRRLAVQVPWGIGIVTVHDGSFRRITSGAARHRDHLPSWSPDGRTIAYEHDVGNCQNPRPGCNPEIYLVSAAGGKPRNVTRSPAPQTLPLWRPRPRGG
jgi:Tol biopolymer transport system component